MSRTSSFTTGAPGGNTGTTPAAPSFTHSPYGAAVARSSPAHDVATASNRFLASDGMQPSSATMVETGNPSSMSTSSGSGSRQSHSRRQHQQSPLSQQQLRSSPTAPYVGVQSPPFYSAVPFSGTPSGGQPQGGAGSCALPTSPNPELPPSGFHQQGGSGGPGGSVYYRRNSQGNSAVSSGGSSYGPAASQPQPQPQQQQMSALYPGGGFPAAGSVTLSQRAHSNSSSPSPPPGGAVPPPPPPPPPPSAHPHAHQAPTYAPQGFVYPQHQRVSPSLPVMAQYPLMDPSSGASYGASGGYSTGTGGRTLYNDGGVVEGALARSSDLAALSFSGGPKSSHVSPQAASAAVAASASSGFFRAPGSIVTALDAAAASAAAPALAQTAWAPATASGSAPRAHVTVTNVVVASAGDRGLYAESHGVLTSGSVSDVASNAGTERDERESSAVSGSSSSSIRDDIPLCENDANCSLINDKRHQRQFAHTCRLFPCYHAHVKRHAKLFRHQAGQMVTAPNTLGAPLLVGSTTLGSGGSAGTGKTAKASQRATMALASVNFLHISQDAPNAVRITVSSKDKRYEIHGDWTQVKVHTLKRYLHQVFAVPAVSQRLFFDGKELDDDLATVAGCGVREHAVVSMVSVEEDDSTEVLSSNQNIQSRRPVEANEL